MKNIHFFKRTFIFLLIHFNSFLKIKRKHIDSMLCFHGLRALPGLHSKDDHVPFSPTKVVFHGSTNRRQGNV